MGFELRALEAGGVSVSILFFGAFRAPTCASCRVSIAHAISFARSFFCDLDRDLDLDLDLDSDALPSEESSEPLITLTMRPSPSRSLFVVDILSCFDGFSFSG